MTPAAQADHPFLNDPRDRPLLVLIVVASLAILPFAALLYVPGMFTWWLGLLYLTMICTTPATAPCSRTATAG